MRILVTGGTGNVGRLVVEQLLHAGVAVRVVSRRPGKAVPDGVQMFRGDLAQPHTLQSAMTGVDRMYLFPFAATAADVVRRAAAARIRRIVTLSSGAVTTGHDEGFHLPVEQAVEASDLEWTHVRPGEFMLNKLWLWGPSIRAEQVVRDPFPDYAGYPVHERDIADVAVRALLEDEHRNAVYTLNGPELISRRDQVRAIADAIGQQIRLEVVTPAQARDLYLAQGGFAAASADFLTGFKTYSGDTTTPTQAGPSEAPAPRSVPTAQDVTSAPARPFTVWARDHATDFQATPGI
ncbi:NAD(P)H-binding protein [Dactylosporangium sp. NPDC051541]|uniref:NAD(P)H-binding protein n=1 Tax=Dactylosporangium sp. NPDC051541 TaxID=3363977 RepID=UPI003792FD59